MTTVSITISVTYDEKKTDLEQDVVSHFREAAEHLEMFEDVVEADVEVGETDVEDTELEPEEVEA